MGDLRRPSVLLATATLVLLALIPLYARIAGQPFPVTQFTRIMVYALAAVGLNVIVGYGAMVSFGHALYIGVGTYAVAILAFHDVASGWLQLAAALGTALVVATLIGLACVRTTGMAFIMITLAFAQMGYFLVVSVKYYGGDDGLGIPRRSAFGVLDLENDTALYYTAFLLLCAALYASGRLVRSRFGMVLRGSKSNERRMKALGYPTQRYRLAAYVLSALVCALAGVLLANLTKYASPAYMQWTVSGDLILMILLGGLGTLFGPLIGALALLLLEEALTSWTEHWMAILGPLIVVIVLTARKGLYGILLERERARGLP
jgi:branched-chain amino acid transport system permease protein